MALRLALSVFGYRPRVGVLPMGFFAEEDVQIYLGLPNHYLNKLAFVSGYTTSRKIVQTVFPAFQNRNLLLEERLAPEKSLPPEIREWIEPITEMIIKIWKEGWQPPPLNVLNFRGGKDSFWLTRAEHLCGQVPDGTHRVLAYTILGSELPEMPIPIRILQIHPIALAAVNWVTICMRFLMDPIRTPAYLKKRFEGSASFFPMDRPKEKN